MGQDSPVKGAAEDELDDYLRAPRTELFIDVFQWWKDNSARYPRLSRMALDYLSIPGEQSLSLSL